MKKIILLIIGLIMISSVRGFVYTECQYEIKYGDTTKIIDIPLDTQKLYQCPPTLKIFGKLQYEKEYHYGTQSNGSGSGWWVLDPELIEVLEENIEYPQQLTRGQISISIAVILAVICFFGIGGYMVVKNG